MTSVLAAILLGAGAAVILTARPPGPRSRLRAPASRGARVWSSWTISQRRTSGRGPVAVTVCGAAGAALAWGGPVAAVFAGTYGWLAVRAWTRHRVAASAERGAAVVEDLVTGLAADLRAGLAPATALEWGIRSVVATEDGPPQGSGSAPVPAPHRGRAIDAGLRGPGVRTALPSRPRAGPHATLTRLRRVPCSTLIERVHATPRPDVRGPAVARSGRTAQQAPAHLRPIRRGDRLHSQGVAAAGPFAPVLAAASTGNVTGRFAPVLAPASTGDTAAGPFTSVLAPSRSGDVAGRFAPVLAAASTGGDVAGALRELNLPGGQDALARLAAAWDVADSAGAPLADVLDRLDADLAALRRRRTRTRTETAAASATVRMLALLPLLGLGLGFALGADPLGTLLHSAVGSVSALVALGLQVTGLLWAERLASAQERPPP